MKKLVVLVVIAGGILWADRQFQILPIHDSPQYAAFQQFGNALLLGRLDMVGQMATDEDVVKDARALDLALRRSVQPIHRVVFHLESETLTPDGGGARLTVSHQITGDRVGEQSAFGTITCEGRIDAALTKTAGGWKVASFTIRDPIAQPPTRLSIAVMRDDQSWPCADSAWSTFSTSWKEKLLGAR